MNEFILYNAVIITVDKQRRILNHGAIYIKGDLIQDIGESDRIINQYKDVKKYDLKNHIILPGLIDVHAHAGHSLIYTLVKDTIYWMNVHNYMYNHCLSDDFWKVESRFAATQRASFGVTTGLSVMGSQSMCYKESYVDEQVAGYKEVGVRNILACGPGDIPWPKKLSHWENGKRIRYMESYDEAIATLEKIVDKHHNTNDSLTKIFVCPYKIITSLTSETESEACNELTELDLRNSYEMRRIAKRYQTRIHTDAFKGMVYLAHKDPNALLGEDVHIQHGQGLSLDEVNIMAKTHTNFSFWPTIAHFKSQAPIMEMMAQGVNVAISTDGPSYSSNFDLFSSMRKCQFLVRSLYNERNYLPNEKIIEMVTIDAAKCIGMENEIGSLEIGKKADIISLDIHKAYFMPYHDPCNLVVRYAHGNDVDNVICNGKFVVKDKKLVQVDEEKIYRDAQEMSNQLVKQLKIEGFANPIDSQWGKYKAYYPNKRFNEDSLED